MRLVNLAGTDLTRRQALALGMSAFGFGALTSLSGCGRSRPDLRVSNWQQVGDDSDLALTLRTLYEEFQDEHGADLQIESIPGGGEYVSKILLSFVAKSEPDVMTLDASSAAMFTQNGVLSDLWARGEEDAEFAWSDFFENTIQVAQTAEGTFAVPLDFTPMVMYYNRRHFAEAGVPEPGLAWTYDDFLAAAQALTRDGRHGFAFSNWMPGWIMWLWNNGGDVLAERDGVFRATGAFDSAENEQVVGWLRDLIQVHEVAPNLGQMAAMGVDPFQGDSASMTISGHWAMVGYASATEIDLDEIGVAPLPTNLPFQGDGVASETVIYESGLSIGRNTVNPELAWEYVKKMTSRDAQERIQTTGLAVCARKDVAEQIAEGDEREQMFLKIVPTGRAPWGAKVQGYEYVETTGQKMMDAVLKTGADPGEALSDAAADIDRYLSER